MAFRIHDAARLSHAYIVSAPDPAQARAFAQEIAAAAVCRSPSDVPCGVCRACRKAASGVHPDIITVSRQDDGKGRLRRELVVEQVRAMAADAVVLPNESERKVYLIEDADLMNAAAQNAALKLLEEPPAGVHFILCAANPQLLLPTVRSRCAEILLTGEAAAADDESAALAERFVKCAARGDAAELLRWCAKNEGMDSRAAASFLEATAALTAEMLCLRKSDLGMSRRALGRLHALAGRCCAMLRVNVGVKHIFGLLAADAVGGNGNEESSID